VDDAERVTAERGPFAGQPGHFDAPFRSTPMPVVERLLDLARVGPGDRLADLGCGDGRIVIAAAQRGAEAFGIDLDPARIAEAEAAARAAGVRERAKFAAGDMFALDLARYDVVTLYLLPHVNDWLQGKLRRELRPGARIASYAFPMHDWPPLAQDGQRGDLVFMWTL
jgi:cyclopropane fatty-acyl-phospholipid synthase-like methyltransferase